MRIFSTVVGVFLIFIGIAIIAIPWVIGQVNFLSVLIPLIFGGGAFLSGIGILVMIREFGS